MPNYNNFHFSFLYKIKDKFFYFQKLRLKNKTIFVSVAICLIAIALVERLWWDLGPNVELVTLMTFLAAFYLGRRAAVIVPLVTLAISDIVLGNTSISIFTWSAYLMIGLGAYVIKKFNTTFSVKIVSATVGGILAGFWFYLWTNFGVWLLDSWGMYNNDIGGLSASYISGLPFLKNQLIGNLIIIPLGFMLTESLFFLQRLISSKSLTINTIKPLS